MSTSPSIPPRPIPKQVPLWNASPNLQLLLSTIRCPTRKQIWRQLRTRKRQQLLYRRLSPPIRRRLSSPPRSIRVRQHVVCMLNHNLCIGDIIINSLQICRYCYLVVLAIRQTLQLSVYLCRPRSGLHLVRISQPMMTYRL
jgi:hypothetical protein